MAFTLQSDELYLELQTKFTDQIISKSVEYGILILEVKPTTILPLMSYLSAESSSKFEFLTTLCGIHYPNQVGKEFGVMYQLKNILTENSIRIKTFVPGPDPQIDSVTSVFPAANWMERQEFDFFGINFVGHPDLRRILNMDEMDYHPMRKEYKLEDDSRDDKEDKYFGR